MPRRPARQPAQFVYALTTDEHPLLEAALVTFGVARDLPRAVANARAANATPLSVLAYMPGNPLVLDRVREVLADHHDHGAWYRADPATVLRIDTMFSESANMRGVPGAYSGLYPDHIPGHVSQEADSRDHLRVSDEERERRRAIREARAEAAKPWQRPRTLSGREYYTHARLGICYFGSTTPVPDDDLDPATRETNRATLHARRSLPLDVNTHTAPHGPVGGIDFGAEVAAHGAHAHE